MFVCSTSCRSQTIQKPVDFSSYEIAKKYQNDKNYLFAYKHLLIFKFTNLDRLIRPENKNSYSTINKQIAEFEGILQQDIIGYDEIKARGFTKPQFDSIISIKHKKILNDNTLIIN
jgi:hypothetical protein